MVTPEHSDEVEIAASVTHSQGQPPLGPAIENVADQRTPLLVLDTALRQPTPAKITEELLAITNTFSLAVHAGTSAQSGRKCLLKDILIECSSPDHFNGELTLDIMRSDNFETLRLSKISPTKWKAVDDIDFHHHTGHMMLIVHSRDGGDEAFLAFTADDIYAMACAEEDTPAEHVFASVKDDNPTIIKMTSTVGSSSKFGSDTIIAALSNLRHAKAFQRRFQETGNINDVIQGIFHYESLIADGCDGLPAISCNLGNLYSCLFERTGDLQHINRAISHLQSAVESTPAGHVNLPSFINNLGSSYLGRFKRTGDLQDISFAISHLQKAVESTPSGHAELSICFNNLGNSYTHRFERTGDLQDIDSAISYHQSSVESTPPSHPELPNHFNSLGNSYARRFERSGNLQDINLALSHHQRAVESTPPTHADLPHCFNNLGNSYLCRFEHTSDLQDIDYAISHHQRAAESTPSSHADLPNYFNGLGNSYTRRFERTGDLQDIDRAISHHKSAVESTPSGHPSLPGRFSNLGNSYSCRFERTGNLQDIDSAIYHHQRAVDSTPYGHANLLRCFSNLGNSYLCRFERTRNLQDIDLAVSHHKSALESTPPGHAGLPSWLNNLGNSYLCRFECTGDVQDIDRAISHHQSALESTPSGHADILRSSKNLGKSFLLRFQYTHYFPDIQNSIASYRRAAGTNGAPSIRMESAKLAAMLSLVHDSAHCLTDFALAISLLSEVAGLEQTIHRRHANLHAHSDFVGSAVATALHFNEADLALEWLEQGRCLVWNQLNQLRTPIDNLNMRSPSLADRFTKVASALESYGTRSALSIPSSRPTLTEDIRLQDDTRNHTLHATEYRKLLKEIRSFPDFHDFLQPPKAVHLLSSLPFNGPVLIFNIHNTRCDALALISGIEEPVHIPLEKFSLVQAERLQKALQFNLVQQRGVEDRDRTTRQYVRNPPSMPSVLNELWCNVVQPILDALGYSIEFPPNPEDRGRIWWCPTGPLAFLPLHAAGIYGSAHQRGSCISDFVVSSYTPTVHSLNDKFIESSTSSRSANLVLVSQPNTPDLPPIPSTRKETHALEALMEGTTVDALLLEDSNATREKVAAEMKSRSWVHFACHGVQDVHQPLESGLCLHDGRLELLEIMKQQIPNPNLAFLSACQTSKGDIELPEEVVHLAAGMLAVGYRGVVGTMWNISDQYGPEFAMEFYQYLLREQGSGGLDSSRAAYALDYATRKVRESLGECDTAFLTWVPYVHFGY